jgi:GGDEF domain-containing protein
VTGIANFRAFQEAQEKAAAPLVGYADGDNFKAVNSAFGHDNADHVLRAMGEIFQRAADQTGAEAYHRSGDEFLFRFQSPEQAAAFKEAAYDLAKGTTLVFEGPDGKEYAYTNPGFSLGSGADQKLAETDAEGEKQRRLESGERAGAGQSPRGLSERTAAGEQAKGGEAAAQGEVDGGRPRGNDQPADVQPAGNAVAEPDVAAAGEPDAARDLEPGQAGEREGRRTRRVRSYLS